MDTILLQFPLSSNVVSFVDRDMVMHYFGGGIGHLKNTPPLQVPGFDPIDPNSDEMTVEDDDDVDDDPCSGTNEDLGTVVQKPSGDVIMTWNGGELVQLELGEDDKDDEDEEEDGEGEEEDDEGDSDDDDSEGGNQTDEDEYEKGEDDYDYASA